MKKIYKGIAAAALMLTMVFAFAPDAHTQTAMINPNGLAIDTVSNSTAEGPTIQAPGYLSSFSVSIKLTKISGTVAGYVYLYGSNDGTNYGIIDTTEAHRKALTDATNTYTLYDEGKKFRWYKALIAGSGTMSASYAGVTSKAYAVKP